MNVKVMPPTASQLEYLVAAVDSGSWTDAAVNLGVSASAFTQGMAELEKRLGVVLFDKEGRRRVPTTAADAAVGHARRVLAELGALDRWAALTRGGELGTIRAGMIDTAAVHHFGDALVRFRTVHPDLAVRLTVRPSAELFTELRRGDLDVVVAVAPEDQSGLRVRPVVVEPLNIYAPPDVRVGDPSTWGPWVGFPKDSRTRSLIDSSLRDRGASYEVVAESSQPSVLREMVRIGMGWTVLVPADAEREPHALRPALKTPLAERTLLVAQPSDRSPSPALERFIAMLMTEATIGSVDQ
jgi:DNA-binding transcriptional LysR family regulator